ncbi:hypothetical protein ACLOJK_028881 [Asimina triloba]
MLDQVEFQQIEYYGSPVNLKSIAQISTPDGSSILIQPFDKSSLKAIEKAIVGSDLDVTPNNDGEVIRLAIPPLTAERRKELIKIVSKQAEEGKFIDSYFICNSELFLMLCYATGFGQQVAIRNVRRDGVKAYEKLEKEKKLSKDNVKDLSSDLQKLTDEYIKKIDAIYKQKEKVFKFPTPSKAYPSKCMGNLELICDLSFHHSSFCHLRAGEGLILQEKQICVSGQFWELYHTRC